jgi:hypothetical protein
MRLLTIAELMRLTRKELCDLLTWITGILPTLPEGSVERQTALTNLRNIRTVLARRALASTGTVEKLLNYPVTGPRQFYILYRSLGAWGLTCERINSDRACLLRLLVAWLLAAHRPAWLLTARGQQANPMRHIWVLLALTRDAPANAELR